MAAEYAHATRSWYVRLIVYGMCQAPNQPTSGVWVLWLTWTLRRIALLLVCAGGTVAAVMKGQDGGRAMKERRARGRTRIARRLVTCNGCCHLLLASCIWRVQSEVLLASCMYICSFVVSYIDAVYLRSPKRVGGGPGLCRRLWGTGRDEGDTCLMCKLSRYLVCYAASQSAAASWVLRLYVLLMAVAK